MAELEKRFLPMADGAEVRVSRSEDDSARLEGYAAVFNKLSVDLGGWREKIKPGAFKRAVKRGADVRSLVDHDPSQILGRTTSKTLELKQDDKGLLTATDLPDTTAGRDIAVSVERGDKDGMSFAFRTITDKWETIDGEEIRTLIDVDVQDVSVVTFPAYPDTSVAKRSLEAWQEANKKPEPEKGPFNVNAKARLRLAEVEM